MTRLLCLALALPLAAGLAPPLAAAAPESTAAPPMPPAAQRLAAPTGPALGVEVVEVRRSPSRQQLEASGSLEAAEVLTIAFPTGGRVLALHGDIGMAVRRGQLLAELDPVQASAVLRAAEAQLAAAEAGLIQARAAHERALGLIERGATTRATLERSAQERAAAAAQLDEARAGRDKARQVLADTRILAPGDGIITERAGEVGQVAGAGQTIFRIAPDGPREALFHLPALAGRQMRLGLPLQVRPLDGSEAGWLSAEISEISPLVDSRTGTIEIRARLLAPQPSGAEALPGLGTPLGTILTLDGPEVISLPAAALVSTRGAPAVWRIDPATARVSLAPVRIARFTSETVEIAEGLDEGQLVAGAGAQLLFPGRQVFEVEAAQ